ncbi:peroxidase 66-like [Pyrus ussuriensis x Pyrus communis]|uniref:Peroxidase 66-like n=1 Tax=Pyrus ussuriensis x Pyrus communis TaxID=2448454 RepID=A0A5N5FD47_9ROSA|nr:peroxidase 66-like [Pyrus ussuriensis x Pyrus communis]
MGSNFGSIKASPTVLRILLPWSLWLEEKSVFYGSRNSVVEEIEDLGTANQAAKMRTNGTSVNRVPVQSTSAIQSAKLDNSNTISQRNFSILPYLAESNSCLWIPEISMMNVVIARGREKSGSSTELKRHYDTDSVFRENADAAV